MKCYPPRDTQRSDLPEELEMGLTERVWDVQCAFVDAFGSSLTVSLCLSEPFRLQLKLDVNQGCCNLAASSPWPLAFIRHDGAQGGHLLDFSSAPCVQEVLHIGSAHNRSAMPFTASPAPSTAPRIITNQYNNPTGLYSAENISSFNSAVEAQTAGNGEEARSRQ